MPEVTPEMLLELARPIAAKASRRYGWKDLAEDAAEHAILEQLKRFESRGHMKGLNATRFALRKDAERYLKREVRNAMRHPQLGIDMEPLDRRANRRPPSASDEAIFREELKLRLGAAS